MSIPLSFRGNPRNLVRVESDFSPTLEMTEAREFQLFRDPLNKLGMTELFNLTLFFHLFYVRRARFHVRYACNGTAKRTRNGFSLSRRAGAPGRIAQMDRTAGPDRRLRQARDLGAARHHQPLPRQSTARRSGSQYAPRVVGATRTTRATPGA